MAKRNVLFGRGIVSLTILGLMLGLVAPLSASAQVQFRFEGNGTNLLAGLKGSLQQFIAAHEQRYTNETRPWEDTSEDTVEPTEPAETETTPSTPDEEVSPQESTQGSELSALATGNLIANPGLQNGSTVPNKWQKGNWGTNTAVFKYPVAGYNSSRGARIDVKSYSSGDAKWFFNDVSVEAGATYAFSNFYKSTAPSYITLRYQMGDGSYQYIGLGSLSSSGNAWVPYSTEFIVPANAKTLTVFHLIQQVGTLFVDQYSLTKKSSGTLPPSNPDPSPNEGQGMVTLAFDDGWLTAHTVAGPMLENAGYKGTFYVNSIPWQQDFVGYMQENHILDLQSRGHEIAAHTRSHADLTLLSESEIRQEVQGNRDDLMALGINNVTSFAYPYGNYNEQVKQIVQESGFSSGRSIIEGLNTSSTDKYLLLWRGPESDTTVAQMKGWIDDAIAQNGWLILSFHEINNSGSQYSNPPEDLQAVVDYLNEKNVQVVTTSQGVAMMNQ